MPHSPGSTQPASRRHRPFTSDLNRRPLRLRLYPDQVLRQIAMPVKRIDRRTERLARDMLELMHRHQGIGLAAPQVGLLIQLIVADVGQGPICVVNPQLAPSDPDRDRMSEGCLSLPDVFVEIERQRRVEIRGRSPDGSPLHFDAEGLMARVIQHEADHLRGVLICDYAGSSQVRGVEC